ncbi:MFS transporter [Streptomyces sp. HSW2009]|uniref:MFS transporter n=1 Tax=Streptomyces sp. HSW2009 TaxID=3142890 RepID=UPI0032EBA339
MTTSKPQPPAPPASSSSPASPQPHPSGPAPEPASTQPTTAAGPAAPPSRPPLWDRRFAYFFTARTVSQLGDAMMPVAAALAVGARYGISGVGLVLGVWTGTFVLLVLFGGVFADRFGARRMMVGADLVRVVTQGVLAVAFFVGSPPFWLLIAMAALAGAAVAMFLPGMNGMVPLIAREPQRANATLKVADALAHLLGPALAGLLIALTGAGTVYALDAGTFLLSALCLALIKLAPANRPAAALTTATPTANAQVTDAQVTDVQVTDVQGVDAQGVDAHPADAQAPSSAAARTGSSLRHDLRQGWQEFRARTWMWSVILIWVVFGVLLFGPLVPLSSELIGDRLGANSYGLAVSFLGAGTVLGGLVALRVHPARPLAAGALAMVLYAALPLCVALSAGLPVLLVGHVVGGAALAFWSVMWATSVQTHTPPAVLNRVSAYELAGSVSGISLGQLLAGPALALASPQRLLLVSAGGCLVGCAALLATPAVRRLHRVATGGDTPEAADGASQAAADGTAVRAGTPEQPTEPVQA